MSKLETPMTRWYWQQVGGTLIEEFCAVSRSGSCGARLLDGVIVKGGEFRIARKSEVSLEGQDIIVVQAKASRLGMCLMGQAFFSAQLMQRFGPRSVESVGWTLKGVGSCEDVVSQAETGAATVNVAELAALPPGRFFAALHNDDSVASHTERWSGGSVTIFIPTDAAWSWYRAGAAGIRSRVACLPEPSHYPPHRHLVDAQFPGDFMLRAAVP